MPTSLAIFDFDDTLTHGDTLPHFLALCRGWPRTIAAYALAIIIALPKASSLGVYRSAVKIYVLQRLLHNVPLSQAQAAAQALKPHWRQVMRERLLWHKAQGHKIVIATGALDIYVRQLLHDIDGLDFLDTVAEQQHGILTGALLHGNAVRHEKAKHVQHYINTHGPFARIYGYGNAPSDLPMLELCDEKTII